MPSFIQPAHSYIRDVWHDNLETELASIREMIVSYPYISMDTEFPGVVAKPVGSFRSSSDYHFQTLRCNVDLLKIIQLGLTFCNEDGELAPGVCTYQFNFKFSLGEDIYAQDSIDLLMRSGIDFRRHEEYGIDVVHFAELFISSGCVLNDEVRWISFHSGYDFGYLMKLLTSKRLAVEEDVFFSELKLYFPQVRAMFPQTRGIRLHRRRFRAVLRHQVPHESLRRAQRRLEQAR